MRGLGVKASSFPSLEGLDDLARRNGVDIRPILVRVLTDLYIQKPFHTPDEEIHYAELVSRLLDAVDLPTRAIVASKLAGYAAAPRAIVQRLARDAIEVAEPILRNSPTLTGADLVAIIKECGPRHASTITARQRREPDRTPDVISSAAPQRSVTPALRRLPARDRPLVTATQPAPAHTTTTLGDVFLAASGAERRVILGNIDKGGDVPATASPPLLDVVGRLEAAARGRRPDAFAREIEVTLGLGSALARQIVADEGGEPVLVVAKAIGTSPEVLERILLLLNPAIGQSVPRVFDLAKLYRQLTVPAALRKVRIGSASSCRS